MIYCPRGKCAKSTMSGCPNWPPLHGGFCQGNDRGPKKAIPHAADQTAAVAAAEFR